MNGNDPARAEITIDMTGDDFATDPGRELALLLHSLASKIQSHGLTPKTIRDSADNIIGQLSLPGKRPKEN